LRRQATTSRLAPAGSGRAERLDPFALPLRFEADNRTADEHLRQIELHRERIVLRRDLRGIKMAVNLPVAAYRGLAIRLEAPDAEATGAVAIVLEHRDPQLSLTLYRAADTSDIVAEWQAWGRALSLPLLITDADGELRDAFQRIGRVRIAAPLPRRRRRSTLRARRPSLPLRRRPGVMPSSPVVHRDEREIIARN
jgi:Family of unknown function (DUF6101)